MAACAHGPLEPSAAPGSPFRIGVGQSVSIEGLNVVLGFEEVLEDSRCPSDVMCVWAGTARLKAFLRGDGQTRREVELKTFPRAALVVDGYAIQVEALEPFPRSNVRIDPRGYVATVIVSRP